MDELITRTESIELLAQKQKQITRKELKELLRFSRWDELKEIYPDFSPGLTEYHGKQFLDWRSLTKEMSLLFASEPIPQPVQVFSKKGLKGTYKEVTVPLVIVEKGIPLRVLESIGDRVIGFASVLIGFEQFKTDRIGFHRLAQGLITNSNLASAGYKSGDAAEIELGCVLFTDGPTAALEAGIKMLKKTCFYKQSTK